MQPIPYHRILEAIRKNENLKLINQPVKSATFTSEIPKERSFGSSPITYTVYEEVTIDDKFNYYHIDLTGIPHLDYQLIYGEKDTHDSQRILEKPLLENVAKIKRNYDITLSYFDNTYIISNGRHRILYLKNYYLENEVGCANKKELQELKSLVTIPAKVTKRIEDKEINNIVKDLRSRFVGIFIYKSNYLNDLPELIILYKQSLYFVKTKEELIDFYNLIIEQKSIDDYKIVVNEKETTTDVDRVFEEMYKILKEEIYQMSYITIVRYLALNPITIDDKIVPIEKINLKFLYSKYIEMVTAYTLCTSRHEELPNHTDFASAFYINQRKIGNLIMEILYSDANFSKLTWDEFYIILHQHPLLAKYDSEYLKDIAIENGYKILLKNGFFIKPKK